MRRSFMLTCLLLALTTSGGAVRAGSDAEPTGLDLLERCHALQLLEEAQQPPDEEVLRNYGYCLGYVVGFVSGFAARDALGEAGRFCPPADARIADFGWDLLPKDRAMTFRHLASMTSGYARPEPPGEAWA